MEAFVHTGSSAQPSLDSQKAIDEGLATLLADSFSLCLLAYNFSWNVVGIESLRLRLLFSDLCKEEWAALDMLAEHIHRRKSVVRATYADLVTMTSISEVNGVPSIEGMIRLMINAYGAVISIARALHTETAKHDELTASLLLQKISSYEKNIARLSRASQLQLH